MPLHLLPPLLLPLLLLLQMVLVGQHRPGGISHDASLLVTCDSGCDSHTKGRIIGCAQRWAVPCVAGLLLLHLKLRLRLMSQKC